MHAGIPPPLGSRLSPPSPGADTPLRERAATADGTHPTGMHYCLTCYRTLTIT